MKRRNLLGACGAWAAWGASGAALAPCPAAAQPEPDSAARQRRSREWFSDTPLTDQDGRSHRFYSELLAPAAPRVVLVHALFTGCSSACPLIVQKLMALLAALPAAAQRELWLLSLSIDPLNDTPAVLKAFAARHGADAPQWRFLTGSPAQVEQVGRRLGLWVTEPDAHQTTLIAGRASAAHWAKLKPDLAADALARQLLWRFWPALPTG